MNYIRHLAAFFLRSTGDPQLTPTHISLYMALFQFWNRNRFRNPVSITRAEVMRVSKILSVSTYHRCIRDLNELGYIVYEPSYNPLRGSLVTLFENVSKTSSATSPQTCSKTRPATRPEIEQPEDPTCSLNGHLKERYRSLSCSKIDQLKEPSINSIYNTNNINSNNSLCAKANKPKNEISEVDQKTKKSEAVKSQNDEEKASGIKPVSERKEKSSAKKEKKAAPGENIPPTFAEVQLHFAEKGAPAQEAEKFFNHYESNGWLVGGRSKMKNWHAAARNWQLNAKKFAEQRSTGSSVPKPNNLSATTNKSYREEL